jgi:hypothetical protein
MHLPGPLRPPVRRQEQHAGQRLPCQLRPRAPPLHQWSLWLVAVILHCHSRAVYAVAVVMLAVRVMSDWLGLSKTEW